MKLTVKQISVAAMLVAVGVILSTFSIPIGVTKCFPIQHFVNVIAAICLGPIGAVLCAFVTSLIRFFLGTGTLLAFPGSMVGALLAGLLFKYSDKVVFASVGEVIGTGILGAIVAYPVAAFLLGAEAAIFTYVIPFSISSFVGAAVAGMFMYFAEKSGFLTKIKMAE